MKMCKHSITLVFGPLYRLPNCNINKIIDAMRRMKTDEALVNDNLTFEMIKYLGKTVKTLLLEIYYRAWHEVTIPLTFNIYK